MNIYLVIKEQYWMGDGLESEIIGCYADEGRALEAAEEYKKKHKKFKGDVIVEPQYITM